MARYLLAKRRQPRFTERTGRSRQTKLERFRVLGLPTSAFVTGMATAIRREVAMCALPVPELSVTAFDDWFHWVAQTLEGRYVLEVPLASYRRHESNATIGRTLNVPSVVKRRPLAIGAKLQNLPGHARRVAEQHELAAAQLAWMCSPCAARLLDASTRTDLQDVLSGLHTTRTALERRLEALTSPRWVRPHAVWRVVRSGAYRSGSFAELAKDLLAPSVGRSRSTPE
jgi:hypothetical protein